MNIYISKKDLKSYLTSLDREYLLAIFFPLNILFGFLGRALFNIDFVLSFLLFLFVMDRSISKKIVNEKIFVGWLWFIGAVGLSTLFSDFFFFSFVKYLKFVFYSCVILGIGLYLYKISSNRLRNLKVAMNIFLISIAIMESITIFNVTFGFDLLHFISKGEKIPQSGNYHLREVFSVTILTIVLFYSFLKPKWYNFLFLAIALLGILASTSRTAYISAFFSIVVFFALKNKKELLIILLATILTLSLSYYYVPEIQKRVDSFKTTFLPQGGDRMSGRYDVYLDSFHLFQERPILGHGVKAGVKLYEHGHKIGNLAKHPHNIYLEILMDSGLIGLLGFILFLRSLFQEFKVMRNRHVVLATFTAIFLSSLASWSIWSVNHISFVLIILTVLIAIKDVDPQKLKSTLIA